MSITPSGVRTETVSSGAWQPPVVREGEEEALSFLAPCEEAVRALNEREVVDFSTTPVDGEWELFERETLETGIDFSSLSAQPEETQPEETQDGERASPPLGPKYTTMTDEEKRDLRRYIRSVLDKWPRGREVNYRRVYRQLKEGGYGVRRSLRSVTPLIQDVVQRAGRPLRGPKVFRTQKRRLVLERKIRTLLKSEPRLGPAEVRRSLPQNHLPSLSTIHKMLKEIREK